jgi:hypothetical protein
MPRAFSPILMSVIIIFVGLAAATAARVLYERWIQVPHCFEYGRIKGLRDLESLQVSEVSLASHRFPGHICHFTDTRTGSLVSLRFDETDIPYAQDTLQIICIGCAIYMRQCDCGRKLVAAGGSLWEAELNKLLHCHPLAIFN